MSVRQLSTDMRIASAVAGAECKTMLMLGATVREAVEASVRAGNEVLSIARRDDVR